MVVNAWLPGDSQRDETTGKADSRRMDKRR
ncbi:hypothetical protein SAMN06295900_10128 [Trinickia caryophylli]|uniref:Uncharacterized protein n=1 Tax=Trinickia caryophylli TaxID=28094 RepID=A0A1X7C8X1_TRICW|nr:hypothetical protein SAMN06295900_10128 [Trinickia caryophylli]